MNNTKLTIFAAASFFTIFTTQVFAQTGTSLSEEPIVGIGPIQDIDPSEATEVFNNFASTIIGFLTILGGLAFALYFILGAIGWITSGGDKQKVDNAKNQMTSAAIGLVIIVASYTIIGVVGMVLGLDILNPIPALVGTK